MAISETDARWAEPGDEFIVDMGAGQTCKAYFDSTYDEDDPGFLIVRTEWYPAHPMKMPLSALTIPE